MRLGHTFFGSLVLAAMLLSFSFFVLPVFAQEGVCDTTGLDDDLEDCGTSESEGSADIEGGFEDIVGDGTPGSSIGLVFTNICTSPKPTTEGQVDTCACRAEGKCTLDNMLQIFVNISIFILGICGSIILLMFIYGGFLWVTSRGDADRIKKGKETVTNSVIGLAIILLSYSIINFVIAAFAGNALTPGATIEKTLEDANPENTPN
jgi:hypothetical protein